MAHLRPMPPSRRLPRAGAQAARQPLDLRARADRRRGAARAARELRHRRSADPGRRRGGADPGPGRRPLGLQGDRALPRSLAPLTSILRMEPWSYALAGRFDEHAFDSDVLKANALGDPGLRPLWG